MSIADFLISFSIPVLGRLQMPLHLKCGVCKHYNLHHSMITPCSCSWMIAVFLFITGYLLHSQYRPIQCQRWPSAKIGTMDSEDLNDSHVAVRSLWSKEATRISGKVRHLASAVYDVACLCQYLWMTQDVWAWFSLWEHALMHVLEDSIYERYFSTRSRFVPERSLPSSTDVSRRATLTLFFQNITTTT
jgi:hypothetical protein